MMFNMCKRKMKTPSHVLCEFCPDQFRMFADAVSGMKFEEKPDYDKYIGWFLQLCDSEPQRQLVMGLRIGIKRDKQNDLSAHIDKARKKVRRETSTGNWIFIFNFQKCAIEQRFGHLSRSAPECCAT